MAKAHATENVDRPERALCGRPLYEHTGAARDLGRGVRDHHIIVNNAAPECGTCLRVIAARYRREASR